MGRREDLLASYQYLIGASIAAGKERDHQFAVSKAASENAGAAQREYDRLCGLLEQARTAFEETFQ